MIYSACRRVVWEGGYKDITVFHQPGGPTAIIDLATVDNVVLSNDAGAIVDTFLCEDLEISNALVWSAIEARLPTMTLRDDPASHDHIVYMVDDAGCTLVLHLA